MSYATRSAFRSGDVAAQTCELKGRVLGAPLQVHPVVTALVRKISFGICVLDVPVDGVRSL